MDIEKMTLLNRYQERGIDVFESYSKYISHESFRELKDLGEAYKVMMEDIRQEMEIREARRIGMNKEKKELEMLIVEL